MTIVKIITAGGNIGRPSTQTIVLRPTQRGGLDVSAYMESIHSAELIDYPRRAKLLDLYANVKIDRHLFSVLRKQKAAILSVQIQFIRDGKSDKKIQEHINSPWFYPFIVDLIGSATRDRSTTGSAEWLLTGRSGMFKNEDRQLATPSVQAQFPLSTNFPFNKRATNR